MTTVAIVLLGYVLGSCPWGYWLPKVFLHEDIRTRGSGNIGVTNVWRIYHARLGLPVLLLDVAKGFVPALLGVHYVNHAVAIVAGGAAMLGHWRPLFLRFGRGGKTIATAGGVYFALAPLAALTGLPLWFLIFALFGYASVASIVTASAMPVFAWAYGYPWSVLGFALVTMVVAIWLHRHNLERLRSHTENRSSIALLPRLGLGST